MKLLLKNKISLTSLLRSLDLELELEELGKDRWLLRCPGLYVQTSTGKAAPFAVLSSRPTTPGQKKDASQRLCNFMNSHVVWVATPWYRFDYKVLEKEIVVP